MNWNGLELPDNEKIILDLCGGTGAWSRPYTEAGYDVRNITLPEYNVRTYNPPDNVYGILAAPPCDDFSGSGARWWKDKDFRGSTEQSVEVVRHCLRIICVSHPVFWVLENPVGRISRLVPELGHWVMCFQPCDFGDRYTKKTCLWGEFHNPVKKPCLPLEGSKMHRLPPSANRKELRAITPSGFARAFYEVNR